MTRQHLLLSAGLLVPFGLGLMMGSATYRTEQATHAQVRAAVLQRLGQAPHSDWTFGPLHNSGQGWGDIRFTTPQGQGHCRYTGLGGQVTVFGCRVSDEPSRPVE